LLARLFRSRRDILLENLALRQQLLTLKRRHPRPKLSHFDRLFWVAAKRVWSNWKEPLVIVTPETVVGWHRAGFRLYWRWRSRHQKTLGRRPVRKELRELIFHMVAENPTWGAPRIHGELLKLGFDVSERSVSRWLQRAPRSPEPAKAWKAFLQNHREAIAAMDFFTVPTLTFQVLYCFFVIAHDRRRILHCSVTRHPTGFWITQQLREAFPFDHGHQFLIHDRDSKFGESVGAAVSNVGLSPIRDIISQPLAKWSCRALGRKLPERLIGSLDPAQRTPFETAACRIHPLLPYRSHASRLGEGRPRPLG
jgi:putative transposase